MQAFKSPIVASRFSKTITGSFNRSFVPRTFSTSPISRFAPSSLKMGVIEITSKEDYKTKVDQAAGPIVVDFFATWCGPCKAISPAIEKLSDAHTGITFYKVDVDKVPEAAGDNGISAMPTFLFRKGGQQVDLVKGADPARINAAVKRLLE